MNDRPNGQPLSLEARVNELERELQALKASLKSGSLSQAADAEERGSVTGSLVTPKWIGHNWLMERIASREIRSDDSIRKLMDEGADWGTTLIPVEGAVYRGIRVEIRITDGGTGMRFKAEKQIRDRLLDHGIATFFVTANSESIRYSVGLFTPEINKIPIKIRAAIVGERCGVEINYWRADGKLIFQPVDLMNRPIDPEEYGQPQWCARVRDAGFVWDPNSRTFSQ